MPSGSSSNWLIVVLNRLRCAGSGEGGTGGVGEAVGDSDPSGELAPLVAPAQSVASTLRNPAMKPRAGAGRAFVARRGAGAACAVGAEAVAAVACVLRAEATVAACARSAEAAAAVACAAGAEATCVACATGAEATCSGVPEKSVAPCWPACWGVAEAKWRAR